jgi:hypothetical protein
VSCWRLREGGWCPTRGVCPPYSPLHSTRNPPRGHGFAAIARGGRPPAGSFCAVAGGTFAAGLMVALSLSKGLAASHN